MNWIELIQTATMQPIMGVYIRVLALILFFGAWQHASSILGKGGKPWHEMAMFLRVWDVILLIFNIVIGVGLIFGTAWSIIGFVVGLITFQFLPYTLFQNQFAKTEADRKTLRQLLGSEALLIVGLIIAFAIAL